MIKGAIFDLDGTLLDSMYIWDNLAIVYLESIGVSPRKDAKEVYDRYGYMGALDFLKNEYCVDVTREEYRNAVRDILQKYYEEETLAKPGVPEFLERMKSMGVKMCIATATFEGMVEPALKRLGLEDYFCGIFTCQTLNTHKTDPFIYRYALEFLGTDKALTPVYEDAHYAAKTVKADGFVLVGISDVNEPKRDEVALLSDVFIEDYRNLDKYWAFVESL
ncbi:MAG: HAD family phosphatase [Clostridia bacterium]|nr:HAD family phosphatase [Clostridia bacterium]